MNAITALTLLCNGVAIIAVLTIMYRHMKDGHGG